MTETDWFNKPVENSRELILKEAFKLFLQKNVEKVTVPELERVTKLQRGAIFYHFKDKSAIFKEVIERYFFSSLNIFYPVSPDNIFSLEEYWNKKNEQLVMIQSWFRQEKINSNPYEAFFHVAAEANLYICGFKDKMLGLIERDKKYWEQVAHSDILLQNSKLDFAFYCSILRNLRLEQYYTACYDSKLHILKYPSLSDSLFDAVTKK